MPDEVGDGRIVAALTGGPTDPGVDAIVSALINPRPEVHEPGPVEVAVEADLAGAADRVKPGRLALAQLARKLGRVIDRRGDDEPASQTAKAVDTLRILMNQIMSGEDANPDEQEQLANLLGRPSAGGSAVSAEVRYPKEP